MRIAIYSRFLKDTDVVAAQHLFDALGEKEATLAIYKPYYESFKGRIKIQNDYEFFYDHPSFAHWKADFCITLGGDGTILDAVTLVRDCAVPIMGINLGRLGFLAMIDRQSIFAAVHAMEQNAYTLDTRTLLHLEASEPIFGETNFALNDCTVLKRDTSSMVIIHTYINGEFLNSYWADGLIIATPTGSTGYSLSCGGPIIFPNSGNFVITPVAPHNLNVRPIVISDDAVISFEVEGRAENFLCTLDSRYQTIKASCQLAVRKAHFSAQLMRPSERNFLSTIREKLNWGIDTRN